MARPHVTLEKHKVIRNKTGKNQHKPCPPDSMIRSAVTTYWAMGIDDKRIEKLMTEHYDQTLYGLRQTKISVKSIKRRRKEWGLKSTRQANMSIEEAQPFIAEIKSRFPDKGSEGIRKSLLLTYKIKLPRAKIAAYLKETEPAEVRLRRKTNRFQRRRFYAVGVNDVWAQDQHDKWGGKFGLWLHCSLDPYTGWINWLKVWWTNSNPRLITKYYLDACRELGAVPVLTQSDPGTENNGVANAHTTIRQTLDDDLEGTLQHKYMKDTQNIKPEINWSVLRRTWSPGFETILEHGVLNHWYNPANTLQNLVFRWLAIPWIQDELDNWVYERNFSCVRADRNKILPHGIPAIIRKHPNFYNTRDFKIMVPDALFDEMEELYAPKDHSVFELTPPLFDQLANNHYTAMQAPAVNSSSFWDVYKALLERFESAAHLTGDGTLDSILEEAQRASTTASNDCIDILPGLKPYTTPARPTMDATEELTIEVDFTDSGPDESEDERYTVEPDNDSANAASDYTTLEVDFTASNVG